MGGAQTLGVAFGHLDDYGYIGVYSSGIFGISGGFGGRAPIPQWEDSHKTTLDDAELKKGLSLVWFGCGKGDFLVQTSKATVEMLKTRIRTLFPGTRKVVTPGSIGRISERIRTASFSPESDDPYLVASDAPSGCGWEARLGRSVRSRRDRP